MKPTTPRQKRVYNAGIKANGTKTIYELAKELNEPYFFIHRLFKRFDIPAKKDTEKHARNFAGGQGFNRLSQEWLNKRWL